MYKYFEAIGFWLWSALNKKKKTWLFKKHREIWKVLILWNKNSINIYLVHPHGVSARSNIPEDDSAIIQSFVQPLFMEHSRE